LAPHAKTALHPWPCQARGRMRCQAPHLLATSSRRAPAPRSWALQARHGRLGLGRRPHARARRRTAVAAAPCLQQRQQPAAGARRHAGVPQSLCRDRGHVAACIAAPICSLPMFWGPFAPGLPCPGAPRALPSHRKRSALQHMREHRCGQPAWRRLALQRAIGWQFHAARSMHVLPRCRSCDSCFQVACGRHSAHGAGCAPGPRGAQPLSLGRRSCASLGPRVRCQAAARGLLQRLLSPAARLQQLRAHAAGQVERLGLPLRQGGARHGRLRVASEPCSRAGTLRPSRWLPGTPLSS